MPKKLGLSNIKGVRKGIGKNGSKPFIIEFAGPPKSGKTTIIERVKYQIPYSFTIVREVSLDSPVPKKKTLKYMEWSANTLINKLIFIEEMIKKEIVLVDCGIISQLALLEAFKQSNKVNDKELIFYESIKNHLLLNLKREDLVVYVRLNPEVEIQRIKHYKFPKGVIINESFLKVFNQSYEKIINNIIEEKSLRVIIVNGNEDPEFNANLVSQEIIKIMRKQK